MEDLIHFLLKTQIAPCLSTEEISNAKELMESNNLLQNPELALDFSSCSNHIRSAELRYNLESFYQVREMEELEGSVLRLKFNSFDDSLNFLKLFTFTNAIVGSRFFFKIWYESKGVDLSVIRDPETVGNLSIIIDSKKCSLSDKSTVISLREMMNQKFVTRFYIELEKESGFEIAKKIIGKKGKNMKRVLRECKEDICGPDGELEGGFCKLRLRGRGSCFREGMDGNESDEDLHLCVSSKRQDVHDHAIQAVERLFAEIHEQYVLFCKKRRIYPMKSLFRTVKNYV
jgi:hypothetical protein